MTAAETQKKVEELANLTTQIRTFVKEAQKLSVELDLAFDPHSLVDVALEEEKDWDESNDWDSSSC